MIAEPVCWYRISDLLMFYLLACLKWKKFTKENDYDLKRLESTIYHKEKKV